jgi:mRNA-decapping enzyme 1B
MGSVSDDVRKQANLRLLKRTVTNDMQDILETATHVVLYEWTTANAWQKCGTEGSLFLCQTHSAYQLVILNRNSTDNFVMHVTATIQLQDSDPYLIFNQEQPAPIRGIWFHSAEERGNVASHVQVAIQRLKEGLLPVPPSDVNGATATSTPAIDPNQAALAQLLGGMAVATSPTRTNNLPVSASTIHSSSPSTSSNHTNTTNTHGVALDKKSLQLALLSLIQEEPFIDLLHAQVSLVFRLL